MANERFWHGNFVNVFWIIIKMYKERDGRHHRPHIHALHADKTASFDLETSDILAGEMDKDDVDRIRG